MLARRLTTILPNSPFLDKTTAEVEHAEGDQVTVVGWLRHGRHLRPPFGERRLRAGDVLLVRTTPEEILAIRRTPGIELHPVSQYGSTTVNGDEEDVADLLVQAVVAPQSDLISRTIGEVDFRQRYGGLVVSLWRKEGWLQQELAQTRLSAGDVLVLQGDAEALARVEGDPAFLMLVPFHSESRRRRKASLAGGIMLASVVMAAFNLLSIEMAALAGAVAMVLSGCLSARQAYQAIDARIYVFIAGAIPLGTAMQQSGTSDLLAGWLQTALNGWSQTLILLALFAVVGMATQFMSDAATTARFAPVAVILAQSLGHPPELYVVTVAMAAVVSFLTPIGHHGNLLVYGPGGYHFTDFVWVGTPRTVLVASIMTWLAPLLWSQ
jgi:di/tricarboxylate transporter